MIISVSEGLNSKFFFKYLEEITTSVCSLSPVQAGSTSPIQCFLNWPTRTLTEWHTAAFLSLWQMRESATSHTGWGHGPEVCLLFISLNKDGHHLPFNLYRSNCIFIYFCVVCKYWLVICSSRWCRIFCWRREVLSKLRVLTSWWPLTQSFSHRVPTSWILQTPKQCKTQF